MKSRLFLVIPSLLLGLILGGVGGAYFIGSRHQAIHFTQDTLHRIQLVARSEAPKDSETANTELLDRIERKTLESYKRSQNTSISGSREIYSQFLPYSKAFYLYTNRQIPKDLNQALASIEAIPRKDFDALVIHLGAEEQ